VKLLLDCHELLWALLAAQKLSPELRNALEDSDNRLLFSFIVIRVFWRQWKLSQAAGATPFTGIVAKMVVKST
jgi:PIN domain nuclease of toxin-antitoxin system